MNEAHDKLNTGFARPLDPAGQRTVPLVDELEQKRLRSLRHTNDTNVVSVRECALAPRAELTLN